MVRKPLQTIFSERIGIASLFLLFLFSCFGWYALFFETLATYVSGAWSLLLGFSFACVFFFLGSILWYKRWEMFLGSAIMFVPALFFAPTWIMLGAVVIASGLAFLAITVIHLEKRQRIHFQYFRVNQAGQIYFIMGLSLAIASAYFVIIQSSSWEELVPRFRLGQGGAGLILKAASVWEPELKNLNRSQVTVDAYLLQLAYEKNHPEIQNGTQTASFDLEVSLVPGMEKRLAEAGLSFADIEQSGAAERYYLVEGRSQLSALSGRAITGEEPITLIFSEVIQKKLIDTLQDQNNVSSLPIEAIPFALAVIVFLTLIPLGTLLAYLWLLGGYLVFLYLLKTDQMEIREHLDEVEEVAVTES